jgi:hypothetical protein
MKKFGLMVAAVLLALTTCFAFAGPAAANYGYNYHYKQVNCNGWVYDFWWQEDHFVDSGGYEREVLRYTEVRPGVYNTDWTLQVTMRSSQGIHWYLTQTKYNNVAWSRSDPPGANAREIWNPQMELRVRHGATGDCYYSWDMHSG